MSGPILLRLGLLVLIGLVVWAVLRPQYGLKVVVDRSGVKQLRGVPRGRQADLCQFLRNEVAIGGTVTILGNRLDDGRLRLSFRGPIDSGMQQRIRNFLINHG